jgi:hypothetical protein
MFVLLSMRRVFVLGDSCIWKMFTISDSAYPEGMNCFLETDYKELHNRLVPRAEEEEPWPASNLSLQ